MRRILLFFIFLSSITISSQELNCQVTVNFDQVSGSNRQVFTTLETPTRFDSNLISTIVFYTYIILGVDADSFALNGGETYLKEAENVTLQAQQSGLAAWSNQVGVQNRFQMIDNLLSPGLNQFRSVIYNYHRKGLDELTGDAKIAKQSLENTIITLDRLFNKVIGNPLLRLFFDAKADEIVNLYSDGPNTRSKQRLLAVLQKISPNNSSKWRKIN